MKLKLVADTSFLISIRISNIFYNLLKVSSIGITSSVKRELESLAKYPDTEGKAAKFLLGQLEKGSLTMENAKSRLKNIGKGESSCVELYKTGRFDFLCCDDVDAIKVIAKEIGKESILMTFDIVEVLSRKHILNKRAVKRVVARLFRFRKWKLSYTMILLAKERGLL